MGTRLFISKEIKSTKQNDMANFLYFLYYLRRFYSKSNSNNWICSENECNASRKASINAFSCHFPGIEIEDCYCHFGQCLFKKLVELGFKKQYAENLKLKK